MDALQMLQADLAKELAEGKKITEAADAEGRGLTDNERELSVKSLEKIQLLNERIDAEKEKAKVRDALENFSNLQTKSLTDPNPVRTEASAERSVRARSIGEALISQPEFRAWQMAMKSATDGTAPPFRTPKVSVPEWRYSPLTTKAAGDPVLESDNAAVFAGGPGPLTTFLGLETPGFLQPRLTVEDLLTTVPVTTGNSVTYPVVKTRTAISGTPQTEGSAKPGGEYEFDMKTETLVTIAGWVKMSTQFLEDAPGLAAYINTDLPLQIRQNVEDYLADALYDAAQNTGIGGQGVLNGTTLNGTIGFDAIMATIVAIQADGGNPNGMLISPVDWGALQVLKADATDAYYMGPFTPTQNPWGLRVIVSAAAVPGLPLVGDFGKGAKLYSRGGYAVDSTNTDQDDFIKNKMTVRCERRVVIGVTYPECFGLAATGTS